MGLGIVKCILGMMVIGTLVTGCSHQKDQGEGIVNHKISEQMQTITGETFAFNKSFMATPDMPLDNNVNDLEAGYGVHFSETFLEYVSDKMVGIMNIPGKGVGISYLDLDIEDMAAGLFAPDEESIIDVFVLNKEKTGEEPIYDEGLYEQVILYSDDTYEYTIYILKDVSTLAISDEAKEVINKLLAFKEEMKSNAFIFPEQEVIHEPTNSMSADELYSSEGKQSSEATFGTFDAKTTEGEVISSSIFESYDLTMVNIWATWCKPCVNEMDGLQALYEQLPDNVNLVTICADADTQPDLVKKILETKGTTFDTIVADDTINKGIISQYAAFPTTVFVDKYGNIIGDVVLGAPSGNVVEHYMQEINQRLTGME